MNDDALREKAAELIRAGRLPARGPDRVWGGAGIVGVHCALCGAAVERDEVVLEIEVRGDDAAGYPQLHVRFSVKMLATDAERNRVTMLVKLAPGGEYPPHTHAGLEELHLLEGELWINDRKLVPGDYNLGEVGAFDYRVWSETGCTCVLIACSGDVLK